ncbi:hypothetical protein R6Q59_025421 [Mikania micrantha]
MFRVLFRESKQKSEVNEMLPNVPCRRLYTNHEVNMDNTYIVFGSYLCIPWQNKRLELPKEYQLRIAKYNYPTGIVFLRTNESQQFKVFVTQHEDKWRISFGWEIFVNHIDFKDCHLILFRYDHERLTVMWFCLGMMVSLPSLFCIGEGNVGGINDGEAIIEIPDDLLIGQCADPFKV